MSHILSDDELWKPVAGHEGRYEVSSHGRVRSLDRLINCSGPKAHTRAHKGRVLVQADSGIGYRVVTLDWKRGTSFVHRLVLEAFVGAAPDGHEGRHLDDNRGNNRLSNLAWGTQGDNYRDAQKNGRRKMKVANNIVQFQAGREAAMANKPRDRRRSKDWLEGWEQVARENARSIQEEMQP